MFISLFSQHNKKELYKSHEYLLYKSFLFLFIIFLFYYTKYAADIIYEYLPTYLPETF